LDKKLYSSTDRDLIDDWADRWFELSHLVNGLIWTDDPPWTTPPPTEVDELEYQRLRFWFLDHQEQSVSLWVAFGKSLKGIADEHPSLDNTQESPDTDEFIRNPFHLFYSAENLYLLAQHLELQSGVYIWEPSNHYASATMSLMILLGKAMFKLMDWIDEQS